MPTPPPSIPQDIAITATYASTDNRWRVDTDDVEVRKTLDKVTLSTGDAQRPGVVWFRDPSIIGPDPHLIENGIFTFTPGADATEACLPYGFFILVKGDWVMVEGKHSPPRIRIIDKEPVAGPGGSG